ncbi:MAG: exodeoxyribonuclease VII large subunit [Clostridiales bacterium]|nr:exodeoxyribonuclease VII large subunit [Clostridiales bacterium]
MTVITVSQVNTYIKAVLDECQVLKNIFVVGEISNFLHYFRSGHMYFTLKDDTSQLKAVMFSSYAQRLKFKPEDGMRVICRGRISSYEKDGVYQLYVEDIQPDGAGALNLAYEQLKAKLEKEGLFDSSHKKPIPKFPKKIGIATSDMGAAIEDIKNITKRRYPICELVLMSTAVQGEQATADIVNSIKTLDKIEDIDLIIVGRGGGSIEDLWAFNTEPVARAVYECGKPIISAVGHETDFTICDFVADLRAPTPSAAAELAVPDGNALLDYFDSLGETLSSLLNRRLECEYQRLDSITKDSIFANPADYFQMLFDNNDVLSERMTDAFKQKVNDYSFKLSNIAAALNALSPLAVIGRGYSVVKSKNNVIKSVNEVNSGDKLEIILTDGKVSCTAD